METTRESIKTISEELEKDVSRREAQSKVSASFKILKDNCKDFPDNEEGFKCLSIVREAEQKWKRRRNR